MRLLIALAVMLLACLSSQKADAQTLDGTLDLPPIVLPEQLTSPITGDFRPQSEAGTQPGDTIVTDDGDTWQVPYQVEGEETLDPESN